jgi:hypothetical protein
MLQQPAQLPDPCSAHVAQMQNTILTKKHDGLKCQLQKPFPGVQHYLTSHCCFRHCCFHCALLRLVSAAEVPRTGSSLANIILWLPTAATAILPMRLEFLQ